MWHCALFSSVAFVFSTSVFPFLFSIRELTLAKRWVLCVARYVFLQRTFTPWGARVGALGGQYGRPIDT